MTQEEKLVEKNPNAILHMLSLSTKLDIHSSKCH